MRAGPARSSRSGAGLIRAEHHGKSVRRSPQTTRNPPPETALRPRQRTQTISASGIADHGMRAKPTTARAASPDVDETNRSLAEESDPLSSLPAWHCAARDGSQEMLRVAKDIYGSEHARRAEGVDVLHREARTPSLQSSFCRTAIPCSSFQFLHFISSAAQVWHRVWTPTPVRSARSAAGTSTRRRRLPASADPPARPRKTTASSGAVPRLRRGGNRAHDRPTHPQPRRPRVEWRVPRRRGASFGFARGGASR
jgi:hypothetical protein